jgi:hypothetical protein
MTPTTLITLNVVIGVAVVYALHQLLAHGIRLDRRHHRELARQEVPRRGRQH